MLACGSGMTSVTVFVPVGVGGNKDRLCEGRSCGLICSIIGRRRALLACKPLSDWFSALH